MTESLYDRLCGEFDIQNKKSDHDTLNPVIDDLFEKFKEMTGWPDDKLSFTTIDESAPSVKHQKPSQALSANKEWRFGVFGHFDCMEKTVRMPFFIDHMGGGNFRLLFGSTEKFNSTQPHEVERVAKAIFHDVEMKLREYLK